MTIGLRACAPATSPITIAASSGPWAGRGRAAPRRRVAAAAAAGRGEHDRALGLAGGEHACRAPAARPCPTVPPADPRAAASRWATITIGAAPVEPGPLRDRPSSARARLRSSGLRRCAGVHREAAPGGAARGLRASAATCRASRLVAGAARRAAGELRGERRCSCGERRRAFEGVGRERGGQRQPGGRRARRRRSPARAGTARRPRGRGAPLSIALDHSQRPAPRGSRTPMPTPSRGIGASQRSPGRIVSIRAVRVSCRRVLQPVAVGHKSLADYTHICGRELIAEIRELAEPLKGTAGGARLGDGVRRRRLGDPLHARAADARRRPRLRMAGDLRPRRVLQRDQAHAQRAPGRAAGSRRGAVGDVAALQRDQRPRAVRRLGRVPGARPAAGGALPAGAGEGQGLGLALPHRPLHAQPGHDRAAAALHRELPPVPVPHARAMCRTG